MNLGDNKDISPGSSTGTIKVVVKAVKMVEYRLALALRKYFHIEEQATARRLMPERSRALGPAQFTVRVSWVGAM